jgi:type III pantothenate kinase
VGASAVGGFRDLVVDGETGIFVPPRDPVALREAIDRLLRDEALRTRMGTAGRRRILEMCSWASVARRTASVYSSALAVGAAGVMRNARG